MPQDWMIDVLKDLRKFAEKNNLGKLAEQLDDTILVAVEDITAQVKRGNGVDHHQTTDPDVSGTGRTV